MDNNQEKKYKRIVLDVPIEFHMDIKRRALDRNISIKLWAIRALKEKIITIYYLKINIIKLKLKKEI